MSDDVSISYLTNWPYVSTVSFTCTRQFPLEIRIQENAWFLLACQTRLYRMPVSLSFFCVCFLKTLQFTQGLSKYVCHISTCRKSLIDRYHTVQFEIFYTSILPPPCTNLQVSASLYQDIVSAYKHGVMVVVWTFFSL